MGKIITPGKSVVSPEMTKKQLLDPMQKMRDSLFVGAIMAVAEAESKIGARDNIFIYYDEVDGYAVTSHKVGHAFTDPRSAAEIVMSILGVCAKNNWNVAAEMLRIHKENLEVINDKADTND